MIIPEVFMADLFWLAVASCLTILTAYKVPRLEFYTDLLVIYVFIELWFHNIMEMGVAVLLSL